MKAYKLEILVIDHDECGPDDIASAIENARYPNRCISPKVKAIEEKDIGEWHDRHPLNLNSTSDEEYRRIFNAASE